MHAMRKLCSLLLALLPLLLVSPANAGALADLQVISRTTGQPLAIYPHAGKLHVIGQPGEGYSVRVSNRTGRRILAVVSVDGVNVVNGETAAPDQTGYVLDPWQSYEIEGWRKSAREVAAFYFTSLPDSYAARTGRPGNVGVIGLAVFQEALPPRAAAPIQPPFAKGGSARDRAAAEAQAPAADADRSDDLRQESNRAAAPPASRMQEKLGTGHGEQRYSAVSFTDFRRAAAFPAEVLSLYYDRYENLAARGILPGPRYSSAPQPFPAAAQFVPDPPR